MSSGANTSTRLALDEVRDLILVGQPLPFHVLDPQERRLLAEGQVVTSEGQLEMLMARGAWVDARLAAALRRDRASDPARPAPVERRLSLFDQWEQMVWSLDAVLRRVIDGRATPPEMLELGKTLAMRIDRHVDVALFMTVRQNDARYALYALQHALHSATVAVVLARQLGWPAGQSMRLVMACLTMNVSTLELQAQMATQTDPPTARQRDQIRAHPAASEQLLRSVGVSDEAWLGAVRDHHERPDGGGYPRGLSEVNELARALRTVDVFTAKISARAIRQALPIQTAAKQLFQEEKGGPLATGLIKSLGLYPPGDLVQLKSGEVAVVTHRGATATTPRVAAITNDRGQAIVDTVPRDTAQPAYAITGPWLDRKALPRIPPERVYGLIEDA